MEGYSAVKPRSVVAGSVVLVMSAAVCLAPRNLIAQLVKAVVTACVKIVMTALGIFVTLAMIAALGKTVA